MESAIKMNQNFESIGKTFVGQYYTRFDDPAKQNTLEELYSDTESLMTFDGHQILGGKKILEKIKSLQFKKINREISSVDSQPSLDGAVMVHVVGRLQCDKNPSIAFSQVFLLKPSKNTFYVVHDIFRIVPQSRD
ncbi:probable nuclear transport factor 2 isoform X1 [Drosophila rhopaloa]|uniref:NTF2-related export protein n=1 Tax=Drosophila rhopaloa TaxID=1041015 RepID=A0A6P4EW53_DRORH|nr:probable nuclear transport factor 2 isoform X1 [Drosophila rhopaloa]